MRAQGMTWFPDPNPDGGLVVSEPDGTDDANGNVLHIEDKLGIDENDPTVKKARQGCQKYAPRPFGASDGNTAHGECGDRCAVGRCRDHQADAGDRESPDGNLAHIAERLPVRAVGLCPWCDRPVRRNRRMTTMTKKRRPLLTISAITLALALGTMGCGKDAKPGGNNSQASPIKYSRCMRAQGITWFPDPQSNGNLVVSEPAGDDHQKLEAAQQACKKYDPSSNSGPASAKDIARMRQASQCMRAHGVPNYPDPDANGSVNIDKKLGINPDDPTVKKAQQECQKYFLIGKDK